MEVCRESELEDGARGDNSAGERISLAVTVPDREV